MISHTHGRNFVVKCGGDSLMENQYICRADAAVKFYKYTYPILFLRGVLKATLITLCFIPTNDLDISKPNFVAGHGTVVQLGCTTIRLRYKQAQQCSRIHQLDFIRAVSWSAQNGESHWSHVHITLMYNTSSFMHLIRSVGYSQGLWSRSRGVGRIFNLRSRSRRKF